MQLVHQPADLGEVAADRRCLLAEAVLQRVVDLRRQRRLELRGRRGERLDLGARPLERGVDGGGVGPPVGGLFEPLARASIASSSMGDDGSVGVGWTSAELDYDLPPELIAQRPLERRDDSRLLVYERATGRVRHRRFARAAGRARGRSSSVVNDTRVVPARSLPRSSGGEAEVLLLERLGDGRALGGARAAVAAPARGPALGPVELLEPLGEGRWRLRLDGEPAGEAPLPPYITEPLDDPERYQTVYARDAGSAAAPTAGLHFTPELLARLDVERVTLHVGLDTFRPRRRRDLDEHELHGERYEVEPACVGADPRGRARARRRHDDRARARDARARRAARRAAPTSSSRPASSSGASTRC